MCSFLDGKLERVKPGDCVVAFSQQELYRLRREIEEKTSGKCAIIYGGLPPGQASSYFISEHSKHWIEEIILTHCWTISAIGSFVHLENFGRLQRDSNPWPPRCRCNAVINWAMKKLLLNATWNKCIKVRLVKWGEIILGGNWLKHTIDCSVVVATLVIAA